MPYRIKLEVFEGPLDLLLYLIQKNEIDIHDIPIRTITEQYLEYLEIMKNLNLEIAGEFLSVASLLMRIKSKMLLPEDETQTEDEEQMDPRQELVEKLVEYMKYKDAASQLRYMEEVRSAKFERASTNAVEISSDSPFYGSSLFDLITAFSKVLRGMSKEVFHKVIKEKHTVSDKVHFILSALSSGKSVRFTELFAEATSKIEAITIFLAILELVRLKEILINQPDVFGEIDIAKRSDNEELPEDIGENKSIAERFEGEINDIG
ncbi:MAG: segregation/condensation protein A [Candidatus Omnitrophica bacterium]|nr:segregation/condensation protein A [Candidatus Omnitrophota bacterium]